MINSRPLSLSGILIILVSLLIALILSILPLPAWVLLIQPQWIILVILYWIIVIPHRISIGIAWIIGLLLDVLYGTLLGEHALALCVLAFLAQRLHRQIRMFPLLQQAFSVFILVIIYQALLLWIQGTLGQIGNNINWFWVSALTSMLLWPWVAMLLRHCQRHFRIY